MRPVAAALALALITSLVVAAPQPTAFEGGLTYSVSLSGSLDGGDEWVSVAGEVTYVIGLNGSTEVAEPRPDLVINYSEGLEGIDYHGFSVESLINKLESVRGFEVTDPITGVLNQLFLASISDVPAILAAACGDPASAVGSRNVTSAATLTTYEGRDSLDVTVDYRINYTDGSWARIVTHSVIDLATLEPLYLENSLSEVLGNCSIEVRLEATLLNPESLPGGVSEYGVVTSRGDAAVVVGGGLNVSRPVLGGEGSVSFTVSGRGRSVIAVAYPPSAGSVEVVVDGGGSGPVLEGAGPGAAYVVRFVTVDGSAGVEVVFRNAVVALPATGGLDLEGVGEEVPPQQGAGLVPYVVGAGIAAILGAATYLILRRE